MEGFEKDADTFQMLKTAAHDAAYPVVQQYLTSSAVKNNEIVSARALQSLYGEELQNSHSPNPNCRSEEFIKRILND